MDRLTPTAVAAVPPAVARQRNAILVTLLALAAAGWIVFLNQARQPMGMGRSMGPDLTMGRSWPLMWAGKPG